LKKVRVEHIATLYNIASPREFSRPVAIGPKSVGISQGFLRLSAKIGKDEEKDMREGNERLA